MVVPSFILVLLVLIILSGASGLMACQATAGKTALESLNDGSITAAIKGKLAVDNIVSSTHSLSSAHNFTRVNVDTERGTVLLSGMVDNSEQKARAEELAGQVKGVKRITNNLQVRTAKQ